MDIDPVSDPPVITAILPLINIDINSGTIPPVIIEMNFPEAPLKVGEYRLHHH
jgi:hypothetical protein